MSHLERRKKIIETLKALLKEEWKNMEQEELEVFLMRKFGCAKKTAKEYIQVAKAK